jgi:hypothetical protein
MPGGTKVAFAMKTIFEDEFNGMFRRINKHVLFAISENCIVIVSLSRGNSFSNGEK